MNVRAQLVAQAVRGPILLITIGVLFAAHQAGILSFTRSWPLILIVLGVMKLLERMAAPAVPPPPIPPPYSEQAYGTPPYSQPYGAPPYSQPYGAPPPPPQPPGGPRR